MSRTGKATRQEIPAKQHRKVGLTLNEDKRFIAVLIAAVLILAPFVANLPTVLGFYKADPMGSYGGMNTRTVPGLLPGLPVADPNIAYTSQALGHRAAVDWINRKIPWWNSFEGVGLPLAGEMQSAALFPPTLLLYFSNGQLYFRIILQIIAGASTYFLLRRLALSRQTSVVGGVLFELNGTFAWFGHAAINPVAFLPLLLLGIERAFDATKQGKRYGWRWITIALALSLYAGFPETAYIDGLLAAIWFALRASQLRRRELRAYLAKITVGGTTGLLLAAPILIAFFGYLREAFVGVHSSAVAYIHLSKTALAPLAFPYLFGPIWSAFPDHTGALGTFWANVGGYLTASLVVLMFVGVLGKRERALRFLLAGWILVALAKTFGVPGISQIFNALPFIRQAAFHRYSPPSWEMAAVILAAFALDDIASRLPRRTWLAAIAALALLTACLAPAYSLLQEQSKVPLSMRFPVASIAWACVILSGIAASLFASKRIRSSLVGTFLVIDALAMFMIPIFSNPQSFEIDRPAIKYLERNLGLARFYTFGPIAPNYGSYFGLASINHNDLPIATRWTNYIKDHLDSNADPILFTGYTRTKNGLTPEEMLRANLKNYAWVGVKYVVMPKSGNPFIALRHNQPKLAFQDDNINIYELPNYGRYFSTLPNSTVPDVRSRTEVLVKSEKPTVLIRRELYFPGWHAYANGREIPIEEHKELFQSVRLPKGTNRVTFSYAPPYIEYGVVSFCAAALFLVGTTLLPRRQRV